MCVLYQIIEGLDPLYFLAWVLGLCNEGVRFRRFFREIVFLILFLFYNVKEYFALVGGKIL